MAKNGQTTGENFHNETKVRPNTAAGLLQSWWVGFGIKAAALLAVLFILSRTLPAMPVWAVALVWVLLSLVPAIAYAYHRVIRKTYNQGQFQSGGTLGRFNSGRVLSMVVAFMVAMRALVKRKKLLLTNWM